MLNDLGTYRLDDLPRPERVVQLCHPDLHNAFPPLRTRKVVGAHCLPAQLTRLVGRVDEVAQVRGLLDVKRWVTLIGVGGVGKTRLATQVASAVADGYPDGVWYVNLAPITDRRWCRSRRRGFWGCRISRAARRWTPLCGVSATGACW